MDSGQARRVTRGAAGASRAGGLKTGAGKILARKVRREDWAESWKRHFKPIEIGPRLLIKPGWIKRACREKTRRWWCWIPGLSFGTGNHPTTAFCLRDWRRGAAGTERSRFGTSARARAFWRLRRPSWVTRRCGRWILTRKRSAWRGKTRVETGWRAESASAGRTSRRLPAAGARKIRFDLRESDCGFVAGGKKAASWRGCGRGGALVLAGILREEFPGVRRAYERAGFEAGPSPERGRMAVGSFRIGAGISERSGLKRNLTNCI